MFTGPNKFYRVAVYNNSEVTTAALYIISVFFLANQPIESYVGFSGGYVIAVKQAKAIKKD